MHQERAAGVRRCRAGRGDLGERVNFARTSYARDPRLAVALAGVAPCVERAQTARPERRSTPDSFRFSAEGLTAQHERG